MIEDRRMRFIRSDGEFDYYLFTPTLFRQYYNRKEPWTEHRSRFTHKLHMLYYLLRGGYNILYLMKESEVVGYIVFTKAGNDIVEGTTKNDIYTIYVTTNPDFRRLGIATKVVDVMLNGLGLDYQYSYKTISISNTGSRKAAEKNGYSIICNIRKRGPLCRIVRDCSASSGLYQAKGINSI